MPRPYNDSQMFGTPTYPQSPIGPGLPVLSDEERLRRNAIQQEWSNPYTNESIDQRPSMASLYEDEPTTAELLAQAQGTLDSTAQNQGLVNRAAGQYTPMEKHPSSTTTHYDAEGNPVQSRNFSILKPGAPRPIQMETSEANAPEATETYRGALRDTARATQLAGAALSPFTGGLSAGVMSLPASAYLAADQGIEAIQDAWGGRYADAGGNAAMAALDAAGAGAGKYFGFGKKTAAPVMAPTGKGAKGPFSAYPRPAPPPLKRLTGSNQRQLAENNVLEGEVLPPIEPRQIGPFVPRQLGPGARPMPPSSIPDPSYVRGVPATYPKVERYRLGPEKTLEEILGSPSIASLRDDIAEGAQGGSVDLTDALNGLGEAPLSPEEIALARAAQRFGRNFRSESTAEPAEGMGRLIEASFGQNPPASASRQTARAAVELSDADRAMLREGGAIMRVGPNAKDPEALLNKKWDDWVNAGEGVEGPIPFPSKAEYDVQGLPVTDYNKSVFGGASFGTEGTFGKVVGPKERTPIDLISKMSDEDYARFAREMGLPPRPSVKPKARRGEGDEAITWNRP